ncbi:50S ribosomal protein L1 [Plutella xylostella]|uniref:50S ribosomal protein L1 n=1 Tax=Plutella xylostella TaxID=51655 RepID=UPI002032B527|nr:50S ribosomal protein L1 [Plutella xylostella]
MSGNLFRSLFNTSVSLTKSNATNLRTLHTAPVVYAARKGTRAKARAKKVKVEVTKVGFIPHNQRGKDNAITTKVSKHLDDSFKQISKDDVFPMRYYRWPVYSAEDAVQAHQETHHPTMFNVPDALVFARVELNMEAVKKNRYLESFTKLTLLPHGFSRDEERTILAFCKGQDLISQAAEAGATTVGGTELVKKIQEGELKLPDYDYIIAHPNILTDLVPIRGLMKRRFPNLRAGTLDADVPGLVKKLAKGVQFKVTGDEQQKDFGSVDVPVGRLNMEAKDVAENIGALLKDIQSSRPKRDGLYITRCYILSPPSSELLKIDPFVYVERTLNSEAQNESDDEDEAAAASA